MAFQHGRFVVKGYYETTKMKKKDFPTVSEYNLWIKNFSDVENLEEIFRHGTLSIGFIGISEAIEILTGKKYYSDEETYKFTIDFVKYMYIGDTILVRKGNDVNIHSTDDLAGKTVAVTAGAVEELTCNAFNEDFASRGLEKINILQLPTSNDAVVAVQNKQADCMIYSTASAAYAMSQQPGVFETTTVFDTDTEIGMAFRKGDTEMEDAINKCLQILVDNGTYAELMEKYNLSDEVSYFK